MILAFGASRVVSSTGSTHVSICLGTVLSCGSAQDVEEAQDVEVELELLELELSLVLWSLLEPDPNSAEIIGANAP